MMPSSSHNPRRGQNGIMAGKVILDAETGLRWNGKSGRSGTSRSWTCPKSLLPCTHNPRQNREKSSERISGKSSHYKGAILWDNLIWTLSVKSIVLEMYSCDFIDCKYDEALHLHITRSEELFLNTVKLRLPEIKAFTPFCTSFFWLKVQHYNFITRSVLPYVRRG